MAAVGTIGGRPDAGQPRELLSAVSIVFHLVIEIAAQGAAAQGKDRSLENYRWETWRPEVMCWRGE